MTEPLPPHTPRDPPKKILWKWGSSEDFEGAPSSQIPLFHFSTFPESVFPTCEGGFANRGPNLDFPVASRGPNLDFQVASRGPNLDFQVANRDPNLDFQVCFHLSL